MNTETIVDKCEKKDKRQHIDKMDMNLLRCSIMIIVSGTCVFFSNTIIEMTGSCASSIS